MTQSLNQRIFAESLLLLALATVVLGKGLSGTLTHYIHPRYTPLVLLGAALLLLLGLAHLRALRRADAQTAPRRGSLALLSIPVLAALLIPPEPLTSASLGRFEAGRGAAFVSPQTLPTGDSTSWNLLQWATAIAQFGPDLHGSPVVVEGFVVRDTEDDQSFVVARYVIACCTADASGVGLPVVSTSWLPTTDSWVRVTGTLGRATVAGRSTTVINAATITPIDVPGSPYLFP